ncbi:MAG: HEAT repeat domain-containing protein [Armatimonadota bacterium]
MDPWSHQEPSIARLLRELSADDPARRKAAVERLVRCGEAAVEDLCAVLESGTEPAKLAACDALERLRSRKSAPWLGEAVRSGSPAVSRAAFRALASLQPRDGAEELRALAESHCELAIEAAELLACREDPEALSILRVRLMRINEPQPRVVAALGGLGDRRALPLIQRILDEGSSEMQIAAANALAQFGDVRTAPTLWLPPVEPLTSEVREARLEALILLGMRNPEAFIRLWSLAAGDLELADEALARIGAPALNRLETLLRTPNPALQCRTARVFGMSSPNPSALLQALNDPDDDVKVEVALALARYREERVTRALFRVLEGDEPGRVKASAAIVLAEQGQLDAEVFTAAADGLTQERRIRERAALAIARIAESGARVDLRPAVRKLRSLTRPWTLLPAEEKAVYRGALRRIEAAGDRLTDLPLPSQRPPVDASALPRPAGSAPLSPELLPRPAGDPEGDR